MKKNLNYIIGVEAAIVIVLIIIISLIPSHRKLAEVKTESLTYEHGSSNPSVKTQVATADVSVTKNAEDETNVDISNSVGGMGSVDDGKTTELTPTAVPAETENKEESENKEGESENKGNTENTENSENKEESEEKKEEEKKSDEGDNAGKTAVALEDVRLRTEPDTRDDMNALDLMEGGSRLPIITTDIESDDPNCKDWVLVQWNEYQLYVQREYVEIED